MASKIRGSRSRSSDMPVLLSEEVGVLVVGDLGEARDVAASLVRRRAPDAEPAYRILVRVGAAAEGEHVGVVVQPREPCGLVAGHDRGAHAGHLVGGDRLADAAAAEDDAALGAAAGDALGDREAVVGVVDRRLGGVRAEVLDLVAETAQLRHEALLELEPGVIAADGDAHPAWPKPSRARAAALRRRRSPPVAARR